MICDNKLKNRIKRSQGQMKGVLNMMENQASCMDILTQLKAIRSSIDQTITVLTTNNLIQTIESKHDLKIDDIDEAMQIILKSKL